MTAEKDYEAIGRYVDAQERVDALVRERHNLSNDVARLLLQANMFSAGACRDTVRQFDHVAVIERVEQLAEINVQLESAISEMNTYAAAARKPVLRRA